MGATTPQSTIKLYNAPEINTRAGETLFFASAADREAYFATKLVDSSVNCTVVKKRYNTIKVKTSMATLETCNYISFINPSYGNKLFYGYIMSTDYLSNDVSLVTYQIDWFLSDMFNVQYNTDVQMEREHLTNREHTLLYGSGNTGGNEFPIIDKMLSEEPLNCDPTTEKLKYELAGDNEGYLNEVSTYHTRKDYDAWNAISNNGRVTDNLGTYDNTNHSPIGMVHVISFTVPKYDTSGSDEDATQFWNHLLPLLDDVENAHTITAPLEYYPFFIIAPEQITMTAHQLIRFVGRHASASTRAGNESMSVWEPADTTYARPYMMVACESFDVLQKIIDYLNSTGNVSSILGAHEMPIALLDEFFYSIAPSNPASSLITAQPVIKIPTPARQKEFINNQNLDPKLHYFPYSYYTLEGVNNGSRMEFKYELTNTDTVTATGGTYKVVTFIKGVTVNSSGTYFYICPKSYKEAIEDEADTSPAQGLIPLNQLDYMMVYSDFPEIPYNTDAYAAFIAGKAKDLMAQNTKEGMYAMGAEYIQAQASKYTSEMGVVSNSLSAAGSALTLNPVGAINGAAGAINSKAGAMSAEQRISGIELKGSMMDEAANTLLNPLAGTEDNPIYENYGKSRPAYIMPNYHPGSSGGIINLVKGAQRVGVIIRTVKRSEEFYNKFNNFFLKYGYSFADVKIPAICKYMAGDTTGNDSAYIEMVPTVGFPTGKGYSKNYYTKTRNMKVEGVCADSAIFIEHLFDGGVALRKFVPKDN